MPVYRCENCGRTIQDRRGKNARCPTCLRHGKLKKLGTLLDIRKL